MEDNNIMETHYQKYGHRERVFLSGFCMSQKYTINYISPEEGYETTEGIITNEDGEKFVVEIKVRDCNLYEKGVLLQEDKWYNMYTKYQEENASGALYICSWWDCVTVTDITQLNPQFFISQQQNNNKDKEKIEKRITITKNFKKIIDNRLACIYRLKF